MKSFILIKPVRHIQIGHLYEHLYCHQLTQILREKGLFAFVDYSVDGKTYYDGYIRVEITLFTKQALEFEQFIQKFTPQLDDDSINGALLQVMAEKISEVYTLNLTQVKTTLLEIANTPWIPLETISLLHQKQQPKTKKGLEFVEQNSNKFLYLTQAIELNIKNLELPTHLARPLFVVIANALRQNLQEIIASTSFCYSVDEHFAASNQGLKDVNRYRVDRRQATKLTSELLYTQEFLKTLQPNGFIERLAHYLQTASSNTQFGLPDDDEISRKVSTLVGQAGWRAIGTVANIHEVMSSMTITFRLGADSEQVALKEYI